jgi:hypothetical protein
MAQTFVVACLQASSKYLTRARKPGRIALTRELEPACYCGGRDVLELRAELDKALHKLPARRNAELLQTSRRIDSDVVWLLNGSFVLREVVLQAAQS